MDSKISRRDLLKKTAAAAAFTIIPSGILAKGNSPNEKLNIAYIGCGNRGNQNLKEFLGENIVALCDPNANNIAKIAKRIPDFRGQTFEDYRKCLDMKGIDAVVSQPPDHHHAFVEIRAMNRGYHVYGEKPLGNSVGEARLVREVYLKNKGKIATQIGVQRHELPNMHRITELIHDGAIGVPQEVRLWCGRLPEGGDFPPAEPVPAGLNWDLWVGPSKQWVEFNSKLIAGGCLKWNNLWAFGSGQITDMGTHDMDMAYWALDLGAPLSVKAEGAPSTKATVPTWLTAEWEHPANDWRPAVKVYWYDGGKLPGMPSPKINREAIKGSDHMIFKGDQGSLVCDFQNRILIPSSKNGDLTYYRPRTKETQIPQSPGHHKEWIQACKTDLKTRTDFGYAGLLTEQNLLALVGYRFPNQKLEWDTKAGKVTNVEAANEYVNKTYREGWELNG